MKRDSIHSGRRPSGLCGAALLIASRLHEFNRSIADIIKVVKVHESTMRKRLMEFGDTPSSALTLEEFMTVDLEEEQDPPCFKTARKKDKERLQKILEEEGDKLNDLQKQIENQLEQTNRRYKSGTRKSKKSVDIEEEETQKFIDESAMDVIKQIVQESGVCEDSQPQELGPDFASIGLPSSLDDTTNAPRSYSQTESLDLNFDDIDDEELDSYIMTESEFEVKSGIWHEMNADYLKKQKEKEEQLQKEREEGKPEKKRKRPLKKGTMGPTNSAGEAIEKIIQEKKISTKINYDVLKSLNSTNTAPAEEDTPTSTETTASGSKRVKFDLSNEVSTVKSSKSRKIKDVGLPFMEEPPVQQDQPTKQVPEQEKQPPAPASEEEEDADDYYEEEQPHEELHNEIGVMEMLKHHHQTEVGGDDYGYGDDGYDDDY